MAFCDVSYSQVPNVIHRLLVLIDQVGDDVLNA